jgi:hypothetical protein
MMNGIRAGIRCEQCGYDLRGLSAEDRCPECGFSNEQSLRAHEERKVSLTSQELSRIRFGVGCILGALGGAFFALSLGILLAKLVERTLANQVYAAILPVAAVTGLFGLYKLASRAALMLGWVFVVLIVFRSGLALSGLLPWVNPWMAVITPVLFALSAGSLFHGFSSFAEASRDLELVRWYRLAGPAFLVLSVALGVLFVLELPTIHAAPGLPFIANALILLATAELLARWFRTTKRVVPMDSNPCPCDPEQDDGARKEARRSEKGGCSAFSVAPRPGVDSRPAR